MSRSTSQNILITVAILNYKVAIKNVTFLELCFVVLGIINMCITIATGLSNSEFKISIVVWNMLFVAAILKSERPAKRNAMYLCICFICNLWHHKQGYCHHFKLAVWLTTSDIAKNMLIMAAISKFKIAAKRNDV